jgi:hypothetical protein
MSYFEDLSEYSYASFSAYPGTKNVGWLAAGRSFRTETPDDRVLANLWQHCKVSLVQSRGIHPCEFCPPGTKSYYAKRGDEQLLLGTSELRIFGNDGDVFAAPTLIYHYMDEHHYRPPDEFIKAVLDGPTPPDGEYFKRLQEIGVEWRT